MPGQHGPPGTPHRGHPLAAALVGLVVYVTAYSTLVLAEWLLALDLWLLAFALALDIALVAALRQLRGAEDRQPPRCPTVCARAD